MAKPIEQIVSKAKSHFKKGEYSEAEALYATVIMSFPNNNKAKQGLQSLKGISTTYNSAIPPQAIVSAQIAISSWAAQLCLAFCYALVLLQLVAGTVRPQLTA